MLCGHYIPLWLEINLSTNSREDRVEEIIDQAFELMARDVCHDCQAQHLTRDG